MPNTQEQHKKTEKYKTNILLEVGRQKQLKLARSHWIYFVQNP